MKKFVVIIYIIAFSLSSQNVIAPQDASHKDAKYPVEIEDIAKFQQALKDKTLGERIAFWAEWFVGKPYDTDPLGEYVRREVIVADEKVDCMYHVFRSVELALTDTPDNAIQKALDMRFHTKGILKNGRVLNLNPA